MKILQLTIELKSDMCCGTGTGDGVQFDTVSAYNDYGLPYIPAKRLKGLLREQAEFLIAFDPENKNFVEILFGKGEQAGALIVNNAEIKNVRNLKEDLDKLKENLLVIDQPQFKIYLSRLNITFVPGQGYIFQSMEPEVLLEK